MRTYQSMLELLAEMHSYMRPHGSPSDLAFCDRFIAPIAGARQDAHGNWIVQRGSSPVLFSSHTDTVHRSSGRQAVTYDDAYVLSLTRKARKRSTCLGSDDTAGVFLMLQLIERGIPGTYVFHYGEEHGGIGSSALAYKDPAFLRAFHYAIAFDRMGVSDVITRQAGSRCASDVFAHALADRLNLTNGFTYAPCSGGIYTDTAEYTDVIPECTNISVGYAHAHSNRETLDALHLLTLLEALSDIDFASLPVERDPSAVEPDDHDPFTWQSRFSNWWRERDARSESITIDMTGDEIESSRMSDREFFEHLETEREERHIRRSSLYLDPDLDDIQDALRRAQREIDARARRY